MNQFKKSEDLEIYEMDFSNNSHLQEVCDIRQPVLFQFRQIHPKFFQDFSPNTIVKYGSYDVKIKDAHDYYNKDEHTITEHNQVDAVALSMHSTMKLFENDNAAHFFSENNEDFLDESGLLRNIQSMDDFLKPTFNVNTKYDLMFGSRNAVTPLRYHTNYRQFICVTSGKIRIKMTPWKSSKYLHPIKDYENYEFRSPIHPINPLAQYVNNFEKTKFLEFDVLEGYILYIPPYWWYSIQYTSENNTFVCGVSYNTIMNCVSNLPDLGLYWLQQQNITKKITKIPPINLQSSIIPDVAIISDIIEPVEIETTLGPNLGHIEQSSQNMVDPSQNIVDPSQNMVDPSQNIVDPSQNMVDPSQNMVDPSQNMVDPSQNIQPILTNLHVSNNTTVQEDKLPIENMPVYY